MALTYSIKKQTVFGDQRVVIADVTFDSSYATGGESLNLTQLGLQRVNFVSVSDTNGYVVQVDYANNKLLVYGTGSAEKAALTQQDASTDLDALTIRIMVVGY